jgi:Fe-S cluster assembly scaffold protein SufB
MTLHVRKQNFILMKLSWNSLRVSIAGAKLSHLAQKDKIWDHGTMVELVKNVFYKMERAKAKGDAELVRKNVTVNVYHQITQEIGKSNTVFLRTAVLTEVSIIEVSEKNNKNPDRFTALIKAKRKGGNGISVVNFSKRWEFVREGEWWLLDEMK